MTQNEIVENVAKSTKYSKRTVRKVMDRFFYEVKESLSVGDTVKLKNVMSLKVSERKGKRYQDMNTGLIAVSKPKKVIKVVFSENFKNYVIFGEDFNDED